MIDNVSTRSNWVVEKTAYGDIAMPAHQGENGQYDFSAIFGAGAGHTAVASKAAEADVTSATSSPDTLASVLAAANATAAASTDPTATATRAATIASTPVAEAATSTTSELATATTATTATASSTVKPGIQALVAAMRDGSFTPTLQTNLARLTEITPLGTDLMPNSYYASDDTAAQLAQLLGGKVVQMTPFTTATGFSEPPANFIQLQNGQTVNAADIAYYARCTWVSTAQLTADITQTINQGAALTNYRQNGGVFPSFPQGYIGPPIAGMDYPPGMIGADGNVINPAYQTTAT